MSAPNSAVAFQALKAHLQTITMANGYRQNVIVHSGRPEIDVTLADNLPILLLAALDERAVNNEASETNAWTKVQLWERRILLTGGVKESGDWETARDELLDDLRLALTRYERPLTVEPAVFDEPSEGRPVATFAMFLWIGYECNFIGF
ncbi:MAG: hypothetical protein IPK54_10305 [Dokdonella sp.]|uniref:hypothetical protein n=1 Tax=Dokdonella sp. TaxID=2291710 RepID=UPI0025C273A0|nr:hypothetical protein [Dokdonella sp.]MBK8123924.1 hypothetical protein [Dokdonella sp.]